MIGAIRSFFAWLFSFFFNPITAVFSALIGIFPVILAAFENPQGAINGFLCRAIDLVASPFPSTPPGLKIGSLINSIGSAIPIVGSGVVYEIFEAGLSVFAIIILVKIYKLIPFKMS